MGLDVVFAIPSAIGSAVAITLTEPRVDGLHEQVAVKLEPEPIAVLFLHPGITLPLTVKVILDETVTVDVTTIAERKFVAVALPAN
jgi:hypothetical protein